MRAGDIILVQTPALKKPAAVKILEIQDEYDCVVVLDGKGKVHVIAGQYIFRQLSLTRHRNGRRLKMSQNE